MSAGPGVEDTKKAERKAVHTAGPDRGGGGQTGPWTAAQGAAGDGVGLRVAGGHGRGRGRDVAGEVTGRAQVLVVAVRAQPLRSFVAVRLAECLPICHRASIVWCGLMTQGRPA